MRCIVDTSAWVEYFIGSRKGRGVRKLLSEDHELCTVECCLAEMASWALKNNQDLQKALAVIRSNSMIIVVNLEEWIQAGKVRHEQRKRQPVFGLMDAVLLVKQQALRCRLVTADNHFKAMRDVTLLA